MSTHTPAMFAAAALLLAGSPALAEDLVFTLHNQSSSVVTEFYASPSDVGNWEQDILGVDVLGSGEAVQITIADGRSQCDYDLRLVFDDGDIHEDMADLCDTGSYTVQD